MRYPEFRGRRLRGSEALRDMVRETILHPDDFMYPVFAISGKNKKEEIEGMPGVFRMSCDILAKETKELYKLGIKSFMVFGIPDTKDPIASSAWDKNGIVQIAVKAMKDAAPGALICTDVCLCQYTDHGHCGLLTPDGKIKNDETLEVLSKIAVSHAEAGSGMIAPSDMMDGRIKAVREALDDQGFEELPIMAYSVKFASAFYGPFRNAADSAPKAGDRKTYQMDPANGNEAMRELESDFQEGADILMVKPALSYLDLINRAKDSFNVPIAAYNVSGEYAMIKAASANGWIDEKRAALEMLTSIKRAGAKIIISYYAPDAIKWIR